MTREEQDFTNWYNKTYPNTENKFDALHIACRSGAAFAWEEAQKETAKEIYKLIMDNLEFTDCFIIKTTNLLAHIKRKYGL